MKTINATNARKNLYKLISETSEIHEPIQITGRNNNAILVSEEDWRAVQETLFLTSIPGMRDSIREGLETPVDECSGELDW
ncbi:MAG: type II toxin-antitoxin system Phd/YefM family antitoxin [bacterium]